MNNRASGAAERLREALSHGILGIVVDNELEDVRLIEKEIVEAGLAGLVERWNRGKITVFYINVKRLRASCLYEECSSTPRSEVEACVSKCIQGKLQSLREALGRLGGSS